MQGGLRAAYTETCCFSLLIPLSFQEDCVCVRVTTYHSNISTRLEYHQQYLRLRASEPWRLPAATGKPCTRNRQDVFYQVSHTCNYEHQINNTTRSGNARVLIEILNAKLSLHYRTECGVWQYDSVWKCKTILLLY